MLCTYVGIGITVQLRVVVVSLSCVVYLACALQFSRKMQIFHTHNYSMQFSRIISPPDLLLLLIHFDYVLLSLTLTASEKQSF